MKIKTSAIGIIMMCAICLAYAIPGLNAATDNAPIEKTDPATTESNATLATLQDVITSIGILQQDLSENEAALKKATTDEKRAKIVAEINRLTTLIDLRAKEFDAIASGYDVEAVADKPGKSFNFKDEIQEIIRPLVDELKNVTKRPRDIEKLRKEIAYYEKHLAMTQNSLVNIDQLIAATKDPKLKLKLQQSKTEWQEKEKEATSEIGKLKYRLAQKLKSRQSVIKSLQNGAALFFKTRGLNLFLAIAIFFLIFVILRFINWRFYKKKRDLQTESRSFYSRFFQVTYHIISFLIAISAALFLLYTLGDWMLLSIAMIAFVGLIWTARHGFSIFWEQSKLLLNVSTVREGERLIYNGIPWQVAALNLQSTLKNPELSGGMLRLPLKALIGMQSRPAHADELWFPCRADEYVQLNDGTFGKVLLQTPEMVTLDVRGGCPKTYPTPAFLGQNPINLSRNSFGVSITFGIDYAHQAIATTTVPEHFKNVIQEKLAAEEVGAHLVSLLVQFQAAAASSLDILIYATFSGSAAASYFSISRLLQRIIVDACNDQGWGIPFNQITVHQAAD